jgi:cephalosporin-C deacetylase-like acetyl esterase
VHVSGKLERDGYTVKRVYWQTWPGYYASGYLYEPEGLSGKAPGILHPHGHWENGARHPVVQSRLIALARKGYVGLVVDSVHAYDYYAGVTPLTIMTWNNIRGIDLLCSLPEVDPERIGCTGCSGGGQQTLYLMCVEDRLTAAVPVNLVSEARRIIAADMTHCPCNHVAGFLAETDETEASAVFAPRPTLYICVTQDWTRWFPQEGYPEIR